MTAHLVQRKEAWASGHPICSFFHHCTHQGSMYQRRTVHYTYKCARQLNKYFVGEIATKYYRNCLRRWNYTVTQ